MPFRANRDEYGYYVIWGYHGKKYHFDPSIHHDFVLVTNLVNEVPDELVVDAKGWFNKTNKAISSFTKLEGEPIYSLDEAYNKAQRQARAAYAHGYHE